MQFKSIKFFLCAFSMLSLALMTSGCFDIKKNTTAGEEKSHPRYYIATGTVTDCTNGKLTFKADAERVYKLLDRPVRKMHVIHPKEALAEIKAQGNMVVMTYLATDANATDTTRDQHLIFKATDLALTEGDAISFTLPGDHCGTFAPGAHVEVLFMEYNKAIKGDQTNYIIHAKKEMVAEAGVTTSDEGPARLEVILDAPQILALTVKEGNETNHEVDAAAFAALWAEGATFQTDHPNGDVAVLTTTDESHVNVPVIIESVRTDGAGKLILSTVPLHHHEKDKDDAHRLEKAVDHAYHHLATHTGPVRVFVDWCSTCGGGI